MILQLSQGQVGEKPWSSLFRPSALTTMTCFLLYRLQKCESFSLPATIRSGRYKSSEHQSIILMSSDDDFSTIGDGPLSADSDGLYSSLQERLTDLEAGVGKRYVCRTQLGFLNVHENPGDPFDTSNIVNQIFEGEIVTSTGPRSGDWIQHDKGGWSIAEYNNFKWLWKMM